MHARKRTRGKNKEMFKRVIFFYKMFGNLKKKQ